MVTREKVLDIVTGYMLDNLEDLETSDIDPERSMVDLGANSLDIVEVVSCSMRELKIKVPRSELSTLKNINSLVDLLVRVANEKTEQRAAS